MTFGAYEQDNILTNGNEPIIWRVLEVSGGKALLLSDKNLDSKPYNTTEASVNWATCTLRVWLNGKFLGSAFNKTEAASIVKTLIANPDNPLSDSRGGPDTSDKVFLLSMEEANEYFSPRDASDYFSPDESRIGLNTAYAEAQGAWSISGAGCWRLRTPGHYELYAMMIDMQGLLSGAETPVQDVGVAVRPALWVKLA